MRRPGRRRATPCRPHSPLHRTPLSFQSNPGRPATRATSAAHPKLLPQRGVRSPRTKSTQPPAPAPSQSCPYQRLLTQASSVRRTNVNDASRRYSAVARASSIGESDERCFPVTAPPIPAAIRAPTRSCSNETNRCAFAEHDPTATRASLTRPAASSCKTAATMEIEITRYRRAPSFRNADAAFSSLLGTHTAARISSVRRNVFRFPTTNSASGSRRLPAADASSTSASRASSGGTPSAAGEALHKFPATVPRF